MARVTPRGNIVLPVCIVKVENRPAPGATIVVSLFKVPEGFKLVTRRLGVMVMPVAADAAGMTVNAIATLIQNSPVVTKVSGGQTRYYTLTPASYTMGSVEPAEFNATFLQGEEITITYTEGNPVIFGDKMILRLDGELYALDYSDLDKQEL